MRERSLRTTRRKSSIATSPRIISALLTFCAALLRCFGITVDFLSLQVGQEACEPLRRCCMIASIERSCSTTSIVSYAVGVMLFAKAAQPAGRRPLGSIFPRKWGRSQPFVRSQVSGALMICAAVF